MEGDNSQRFVKVKGTLFSHYPSIQEVEQTLNLGLFPVFSVDWGSEGVRSYAIFRRQTALSAIRNDLRCQRVESIDTFETGRDLSLLYEASKPILDEWISSGHFVEYSRFFALCFFDISEPQHSDNTALIDTICDYLGRLRPKASRKKLREAIDASIYALERLSNAG
jgi:hypothetical protein